MAGVPYNPLMRASASQVERPKPNSIYEALQASARQATNDFNSSSFSQSMSNDVSAAANSIYAALMAPGDAMRGNLNSYEIDPNTGYTMNTGLMDAATNMAGIVQLGSLPMPRPSGSLGMGGAEKVNKLLAEARARISQRESTVQDLIESGRTNIRMDGGSSGKALVGPDMSSPGGYRVTYFDVEGVPNGHAEYKTYAEAINRALIDGFKP